MRDERSRADQILPDPNPAAGNDAGGIISQAAPEGEGLSDAFEDLIGVSGAVRDRALDGMSVGELEDLEREWQAWAHAGRREPPEPWTTWVMMAGRGFGKTRTGAEWIDGLARRDREARIALVGASLHEARTVMVEGPSGILARAPGTKPRWYRTDGRLVWPSGAEARLFSGAAPETLRGPEHSHAWCDELAKWARAEKTWTNLSLGLRVGARPRALVTTTPRPMALLHAILAAPDTVLTRGRTADNPYLAETVRAGFTAAYGGTRVGRQELDGELIDGAEGSLWPRDLIELCRVRETPEAVRAGLRRVVIGVDPPGGSGRQADACGIVAAGIGGDGRGYVLEDASVLGRRPEGWARAVVATFRRWDASRVVAEKNMGGDMVESVLRAVEPGLPLTLVHASKGKSARAEPVAALYEKGRVFHAGAFPALEDEMAGLTAGGGYEGQGAGSRGSPDRADALVWALSELMLGTERAPPRVVAL